MQSDAIQLLLWLSASISTVAAAVTVVVTVINKIKSPNAIQNERIRDLEDDMKKVKQYLDADNKKIQSIEEGNKATQKALLALMGHALNMNDGEKLMAAKEELEQYLINR